MTFEVREGQGSLFVNERKEGEQQPDYSGNVRIGGVLYRVAGWRRTSRGGKRWLALKVEAADQQQQQNAASTKPAAPEVPFDDDIPF